LYLAMSNAFQNGQPDLGQNPFVQGHVVTDGPANMQQNNPGLNVGGFSIPFSRAGLDSPQVIQMKQRVLMLSVGMAAFLVLNELASTIFGAAKVTSILHTVINIFPKDEDVETPSGFSAASLIFSPNRISRTFFSILVMLVVPALGFFGVVQGEKLLIQLFMCGNLCCSSCGIIYFFVVLVLLVGFNSFMPKVVHCLDTCDPQLCVTAINVDPGSEEGKRRTIDCLAIWPDYQVEYQDIPHLKGRGCMDLLNCTSNRTSAQTGVWGPGAGMPGFNPTPAPFPGFAPLPSPPPGPFDFSVTRRLLEEEPMDQIPGMCFMGKELLNKDHALAPEDAVVPGMYPKAPKNPLESCKVVDHMVEIWSGVKEAAPEIQKSIRSLAIFKLVLSVPAIALSCLGFAWGMQLEKRMSSGYRQIGMAGSGVVGQPLNAQPFHPGTQGYNPQSQ